MNIKWKAALAGGLALLLMNGAAVVYAFSDTAGNPAEAQIEALQQAGVISGVSDDMFAPQESITTAAAVQMIVNGLKLNIDNLRFIKEPKASDSFTKVADDAWYAKAFLIAKLNGLPLDRDVDPNAPVTREKFVQLLQAAVNTKGQFAQILMFVQLADADQVSKDQMSAVQWSVIGKIATLDADNRFRPQAAATRAEAAAMVYNAIQFVDSHTKPQTPPPADHKQDVTLSVDKVNDQINQATVSWGEQPNPGYRITIDRIDFNDASREAVLTYSFHYPEPGIMYPQHVVEAKASVYLDAEWKPVLQPAAGQTAPSAPLQGATNAAPDSN
jgi:hypothetical protein